jgi:hypothetical protein
MCVIMVRLIPPLQVIRRPALGRTRREQKIASVANEIRPERRKGVPCRDDALAIAWALLRP